MSDLRYGCAECFDYFTLGEMTWRTLTRGRGGYCCALCAEKIDANRGLQPVRDGRVEYDGVPTRGEDE